MAPKEGRVAKPERRWGFRRGTGTPLLERNTVIITLYHIILEQKR